jgi:hypothetical protein
MKKWVIVLLFCPLIAFTQIRSRYISDPPIEGNEPSIYMNPADPDDIWLAFNNHHVFHTLNRGEQWLEVTVDPPQGFYGDPVIYHHPMGITYLAHLAKNKDKPYPASFDCIVFERSTNGVEFHAKGIGGNGKMQDKPWFAVDEWPKSEYVNQVYLVWTEFDVYGSASSQDSSRIRFAYSADMGATFSTPVVISDVSGDAIDGSGTAEGATIGVLSDGSLICVWSRADTLWYDVSTDGGRTWGLDQFLAATPGGWNHGEFGGMVRSNSLPFLTHDKKGNIYVVYGSKSPHGDWDIWYRTATSTKSGFGHAMRINDDNTHTDQTMPFATIDRNTGMPRVIWYDLRNSLSGKTAQIFTSELSMKGTGKNINLSPEPIALVGKKRFYGDYISFSTAKKGGGMAAVTVFDDQTNFTTIQLLEWFGKCPKPSPQKPVLVINPLDGSDSFLFVLNMPGETSFTFEIKSGPKVYNQQVFTAEGPKGFRDDEFQEVFIPKNRLPSGVYQLTLKRDKKLIKKRFWVE